MSKSPTFLQEAIGPLSLLVSGLVFAVHFAFGSVAEVTRPMLFVGHAVDMPAVRAAAEAAGKPLRSSDGLSVDPGQALYEQGADDISFVLFYAVALVGLRFIVQSGFIKPAVRVLGAARGVELSSMKVHKIAENGWQVVYYCTAWCTGVSLMYNTDWWFGGWTGLGGRDDWAEHLWHGYPHRYHTFEMKTYYLVQAAFWFSMIFVTFIEEWRSDTGVQMVHHFLTFFLVSTSYHFNQVRVGTAILVEQDLADIFLPLAKTFKYLDLPTLGDAFFAIFAVAWFPTRHFVFFLILYSIYVDYPVILGGIPGGLRWAPEEGIMLHPSICPVYLTLLTLFQGLMLYWGLFCIAPAVYGALFTKGTVDDNRSDDDIAIEQNKNKKKTN